MPNFAQPVDYGAAQAAFANIPSPIASFNEGLKSGFGIQQLQMQQQAQKAQFQRAQQMQQAAMQVAKNPTPESITQLSIAFPEMSEQFKRSYDMMAPQQQRADLQHMTGVYAALQSGRADVAAQLLRDRATALENSGANPQYVNAAKAMAQWAELHPETLKTSAGVMLASVMGPEKFGETFKGIASAQTEQEKRPAEVATAGAKASTAITEAQYAPEKALSDIAKTKAETTSLAARLSLDADKLMSETQVKLLELRQKNATLPDDARKLVNEATMGSVAAGQSAAQMIDLATRLEQEGGGYGAAGSAAEWIKKATGNQGAMTGMRQEYVRLRNSAALKMLPPGPASDKDIQVAMKGFPDETADAAYLASFLRGVAKMQQRDAIAEGARAEWVNAVGHLGKPKTDLTIDGVAVPAGMTFPDFLKQYLPKALEKQAAQEVQGRSYMRWATPQTGGATGSY